LLKGLKYILKSTSYSLDDHLFQRLLNLIKDDNVGEETEKCFVDTVLWSSRTTLANISHTVLVDLIISNLEGLSNKSSIWSAFSSWSYKASLIQPCPLSTSLENRI
jgi:hypothetical protein